MKRKARKKKSQWEVYLIRTKSNQLYTGITTDLDRRFQDHLEGKKGARFFRFSDPEEILYREPYPNRSQATRREHAIKSMTRKEKIALINRKLLRDTHTD